MSAISWHRQHSLIHANYISFLRNICHGSDSVENAEKEIQLWFPEGVNEWHSHSSPWIYEKA
jgi:Nucleoside diphosphate kinase